MIRVLFILPNLQGGGAERVVLDLVRHLDRRRFEPALFLLKREGAYWDEVPPDAAVASAIEGGRLLRHAASIVRALVPEVRRSHVVVGALELDPTYFAYAAARMAGRPLVAWVHTELDRFLSRSGGVRRWLARTFYRRVPMIVVPSEGAAQALRRFAGVDGTHVTRIPNMIDIERIEARAAEQSAISLSADSRMVLAVGRLGYEKGFDLLLKAHALLIGRGVAHRLVIAGEGPERRNLEHLASRLGIVDTATLLGFVANPYGLMRAARLLVLPSRYEGLPVVLLEALALGLQVVATDCASGPREILDGGRLGRLVPPEDAVTLSEAIEEALARRSPPDGFRLQAAERVRAFAPAQVVPMWEQLLRALAQ